MAFRFIGGRIVGPRGDTGLLTFVGVPRNHVFTDADRFVFTLRSRDGSVLMRKTLPISEGGRTQVALTHEETAALPEGTYAWSARYVLGAQTDETGRLTGGREVDTPFRHSEFEVQRVVDEL